ncbi:hypothetical protein [Paracoccus sp. (in: a-proteobacteria)]|uniref:hypothetical protein n=1 Tax=Paracoccus sp. TaxID=267 RepID=UPI003A8545BA
MPRNTAPRNTALALLALPLTLAACATPLERCINRQTHEYQVVSRLLAETEASLARGYRWQERLVESDRLVQCRDYDRDDKGRVYVRYYPCWDDYVTSERYREPIDPEVETRKRDNLITRRDALAASAEASVKACKAAYPETGS